jgi:hypothetical protein
MEDRLNLIHLFTLIAVGVSLLIPLYGIPSGIVALFRRSPYSPWPPLLASLGWLAQWPALFVLAFTLPGAPSFSGDGQESAAFDLSLFCGFVLYNGALGIWVNRHRRRFLPAE